MSEPPVPILAVYHDESEQSYSCALVACSMPAQVYGVILYDVARQVAKMFAQNGFTEETILAVILQSFDQEREKPTSEVYCKRLDS